MIEYMTQFGGSNVHKCKLYNNQNHIQTWSWQCTTSEALPLIKAIQPYLIDKKDKCKILIEYIKEYEKFREYSTEVLKIW